MSNEDMEKSYGNYFDWRELQTIGVQYQKVTMTEVPDANIVGITWVPWFHAIFECSIQIMFRSLTPTSQLPSLEYSRQRMENRFRKVSDVPRMASPQPLNTIPSMIYSDYRKRFHWTIENITAFKQLRNDYPLLSNAKAADRFINDCQLKSISPPSAT